jgi:hypothetical protein
MLYQLSHVRIARCANTYDTQSGPPDTSHMEARCR